MEIKKLARLKTAEQFRTHLHELGADLPLDDSVMSGQDSVLGQSLVVGDRTIGNRFCILPMEGWDGTSDGKPSGLTRRRWLNFGRSGAKLIWGGEAVAVNMSGRANPNQLVIDERNLASLASLREELKSEHAVRFQRQDDLMIGLQLTHSGRFARPSSQDRLEPQTLYRHPVLDPRFQIDEATAIMTDDQIKRLIDEFIEAAVRAETAGFDFVDIKHCHGYFGHELLSAFDRPGPFGGSFENRTRFLRDVVAGIRGLCPRLELGVRLSIFDFVPFQKNESGVGVPSGSSGTYVYAFGGDGSGVGIDLDEPSRFLELLKSLRIELLCTTAGSPYYVPHIQRPAAYPPSDGYLAPEDPLLGVARLVGATAELKRRHPELIVVGSGYSYLQEWLPNVAQAVVRQNQADCIGLGRMVLSYPDMPADVLSGETLKRRQICRTFSDCTTAPRHGMVSGCYPLDDFYKQRPEFIKLKTLKSSNQTDRKS